MSATSEAGFTPEDKIVFKRIRDDILARPDYYRPGMDYLQRRWSAAVLHENDLAERERLYEPDSRSARQLAIQFAGKSTGPEYEHAYRHFMQPQTFWLANSLTYAFGDLRQEGLGTGDDDLLTPYDLDKAKAILCLTWLLTDPQADQHELGAGFGKWGDDFAEQIALKGRAMARLSVFDGHSAREWRGEWVRLAGKAWEVLHLQPESTGTDGQAKSIEEGATTPPSASVDAKPGIAPGAGEAVAQRDLQAMLAEEDAAALVGDLLRHALVGADVEAGHKRRQGVPESRGMTWQQARTKAESHIDRNPFPGVNALARIVGCSQSTMSRAIKQSPKLLAAKLRCESENRSVSDMAMPQGTMESTAQTRERDPADAASQSTDAIFARLLQQAKPEERARLNAMTPAEQQKLIANLYDPDAHELDESPRIRSRSR